MQVRRLFHGASIAVLIVVAGGLVSGRQVPAGGLPKVPATVRLDAAEAARLAREVRAGAKVELPPGLELTLWAPQQLLIDPVAIDIDARGRAYVTSTTRNNLPLDIRPHPDWTTTAHTLKTTDELRRFYLSQMAIDRSAVNTWIVDMNGDGSRDYRDLEEMKERVYRIQDTNGDGIADLSELVMEGFNKDPVSDIAGGILYHEGDLIVGVPPGIYRLHDTNGDGKTDRQTTISEGFYTHPTFGGHGISGVTIGPDGRLYWEVGDMGMHVVDAAGRAWSYPNQGVVVRSELDGSGFEVFASGIRNLQEFSFDEHANLISVDNDGDHQGETERLVYLTYGSDTGWRSNWQYGKYTDPKNNRYNVWMAEGLFKTRHVGQSSHILPALAPWHAGPAGMAFNPGTALSDEWRKHFFVASFPGGAANARIYGFTLDEDGAGFSMGPERTLLRGILTVGMKIGPDGALYLTDFISGFNSNNNGRLWKLDTPATAGSAARKEVQALLLENFADRPSTGVAPLLQHIDMRIRQKAQFDLVRRRDVGALLAAAKQTTHPLARLHGLWGIGQLARRDPGQASSLTAFLTDSDAEVRAQAVRMIGDVRYAAANDRVVALLADPAPRVRYFAAETLARTAYAAATRPLIEMLAQNDGKDVHLQHAATLALASIGDSAALGALSSHPSRALRTAAVMALRRMRHPAVARLLADADEWVATDAARAINDDGSIPTAVPQLAGMLGRSTTTNEPFVRRAINANLRVGSAEAVGRLGALANDGTRPMALRLEAVAALGVWTSPSPLDRVDGFYLAPFGLPAAAGAQGAARDGAAAASAIAQLIESSVRAGTPAATAEMKIALAEAAGRLNAGAAAPALLGLLRTDPSAPVRVASLQALQVLRVGSMDELMQVALADSDAGVRRAALSVLPSLPMSAAAKVQHLTAVVSKGSLVEQQGAFEVLGALKTPESRRQLATYLDDLIAGRTAPELQIDLVSALETDGGADLAQRLEAQRKTKAAATVALAFPDGLLRGGDSRRGRLVFTQNAAAECTRCHSVGVGGSDVGPNLRTIGTTLLREQLLEALVNPSARVAPGFGVVTVTLKSGESVSGTLREETATEIVMLLPGTPAVERRVSKAQVAERTDPVSAMPPLGLALSPRDVRDLVEYLATLK